MRSSLGRSRVRSPIVIQLLPTPTPKLRLDGLHSASGALPAAATAGLSYGVGALLPLTAMYLVPLGERMPITFLIVLVALGLTGWLAARLTDLPAIRLMRRNVLLGAATMVIGVLVGKAVGLDRLSARLRGHIARLDGRYELSMIMRGLIRRTRQRKRPSPRRSAGPYRHSWRSPSRPRCAHVTRASTWAHCSANGSRYGAMQLSCPERPSCRGTGGHRSRSPARWSSPGRCHWRLWMHPLAADHPLPVARLAGWRRGTARRPTARPA